MKLIYTYHSNNILHGKALVTDRDNLDEIKTVLGEFIKDKVFEFEFINDGAVALVRGFQFVDYFKVLTLLKNAAYEFTSEVENFYQYLFEQKNRKEVKEDKPKTEEPEAELKTVFWCPKYDCAATSDCYFSCWYRKKYFNSCRPKMITI